MTGSRLGRGLRRVGFAVLILVCAYVVVRAVVEVAMVVSGQSLDPNDWGGPTTAGILAVHCVPGLIGALVLFRLLRRRSV